MKTKRVIAVFSLAALLLVPAAVVQAVPETTTQRKAEAKQRVAEAKEEAKAKSLEAKARAEQRKTVLAASKCEARKERLKANVPKLSQGVTSVKKTLDKNYDRIKAVHDSGKLTSADYDELLAVVDEEKARAETAMSLIDPTPVNIDCAAATLGTQLDSYRATVKEARTSLKSYHRALVDLVSSMNASETDKSGETDKNTQDIEQTQTPATRQNNRTGEMNNESN